MPNDITDDYIQQAREHFPEMWGALVQTLRNSENPAALSAESLHGAQIAMIFKSSMEHRDLPASYLLLAGIAAKHIDWERVVTALNEQETAKESD